MLAFSLPGTFRPHPAPADDAGSDALEWVESVRAASPSASHVRAVSASASAARHRAVSVVTSAANILATTDPEHYPTGMGEHADQRIAERPRIARKRPGKQKPEALGRRLLAIVVYDKRCRIGGTLTLGELAETSVVGDWKMPDFRMACSYAVAQGWLIVEYDTMTLTMAGLSGLTIGVSHSGHSAEPHGRRPTLR